MEFIVVDNIYKCNEIRTIYLVSDNWDDWFTYTTLYNVYYVNSKNERIRIGGVKIGQKEQEGKRPNLPQEFEELSEEFFSLGVSEDYYLNLKNAKFREEYLKSLKDIAFDLDLFEQVKQQDVTTVSLLRDKTESMIKGQYNRMAHGGAKLTDYNFSYTLPDNTEKEYESEVILEFEVKIEKTPPSNIHVLIGKNGVGKTTILRNMIYALETKNDDTHYGKFITDWSSDFSNIIFISFSAFDRYIKIENPVIPYLHIGLVKEDSIKGYNQLAKEFCESLYEVIKGTKIRSWNNAIDILESDNTFTELNIRKWANIDFNDARTHQIRKENSIDENEVQRLYKKRIEKLRFAEDIEPKFKDLSSGHKVILLTVIKLIESVEEKTLVLLDEPEEHLHPPLVSAFIRALSNLLIYKNGVGIVATHSPVIVQEVPKKCVWVLRRAGNEIVSERPVIETFGENLGILTSEIFGYEVTNSGFHSIINEVVKKRETYKSALRYFEGNLGNEGKSILKSLMYEKEQEKENEDD